jgi:signal transduction histidine kinase
MKIRLPLRVQITALLAFFVILVAYAAFTSAFAFLERDKLATVRELETLHVADTARDVNDRLNRVRLQLRESGVRLLDPGRGTLELEPEVWTWVMARDKSWRAPGFSGAIPAHVGADLLAGSFVLAVDLSSKDYLIIEEGVSVVEGKKETTVMVRGRVLKKYLLGDEARLNRGPIRGLLVEIKDKSPRIWFSESETAKAFLSMYDSIPAGTRVSLTKPSQPSSREWDADGTRYILSWATVPATGAAQNLLAVAFVDQQKILAGFFRTKVELAFWSFLLLGFGILAATFLGGRISSPIERLVKAAQVLETGDFSVRVNAARTDEVGDLAAAFNHMGEALEQREKDLAAAQSALVQNEKLAALGTLSAGIAHEVKNPLAGILGHADMTANQIKKLPNEFQSNMLKHIETIQKEVKRCRGIIDNLMRFSRREESEAQRHEPVDLETVAWEALNLTEHPLNLAKVKVEKKFSQQNAMLVNGNSNQIEQVILNMLQNAGHAMSKGGTITVSTEYFSESVAAPVGRLVAFAHPEFKGSFMRLRIQDHGSGMTTEVQRKIFEPFFTTKPKGLGTGLGLSVTMSILADHKARISLNSAPNEGTEFLIDFMATAPRNRDVMTHLDEIRSRAGGGQRIATDVQIVKPSAEAHTTGFGELQTTTGSRPPPPPNKNRDPQEGVIEAAGEELKSGFEGGSETQAILMTELRKPVSNSTAQSAPAATPAPLRKFALRKPTTKKQGA